MILPTTLTLAAAAAIINVWIFLRIGKLRASTGTSVGDGGHELLARRMRAHANFTENVPLALILIAAIEFSGKGGQWLAIVGAVFMAGRVAHVLGMDRTASNALRGIGAGSAFFIEIGLAVMAVLIALGRF